MFPALALVVTAIVAQPATAVVGIGEPSGGAALVHALGEHLRGTGALVVPEAQLLARLTGTPDPRAPDEESVARLLADAQEHEARFDSAGADALRQEVQRAFARALWPSGRLRWLAAEATFARIAALVAAGAEPLARSATDEAVRRFPEWHPDPARYLPAAATLLAQARAAAAAAEVEVVVASQIPGVVYVDGLPVGELGGELRPRLPTGRHRIWLVAADGRRSLPHPVEVGPRGAGLVIHLDFEARLQLTPVVAIRCAAGCAADLAALGRLAGVDQIIGVYPPGAAGPDGLRVDVATGEPEEWTNPLSAAAAPPPPVFSPWSLVPFGAGQFAQGRPLTGTAVAALEAALAGWHVWAWQAHAAAADRRDLSREPELRRQRNLSAGLLYGALLLGVGEAVLYGLVTNR